MSKSALVLILVVTAAISLGTAPDNALAETPRVVEMSPENGATDVAPGTDELRVVFDRDMTTKGFSFCGGGPAFPPIQGNPKWINKRTIVAKVKLEPDHDYSCSLNCPAAQNFRSADGTPLEPVPWTFSTSAAEKKDKTDKAEQKKLNEQSLKKLMKLLKDHYSYYELHSLDWKALEKKHRSKIVAADSTRAWTKKAAELLSDAKDPHLWLTYKGQTTATHRRNVKLNFNLDGLKAALPSLKERNRSVYTARTDDNIGYILITTLASDRKKDLEEVQDVLKEYKDCKALIIDLRPNSGGAEPLAMPIAAWFVKGEKVYSKNAYRDPEAESGFTEVLDRKIKGNDSPNRFDKPVAVLSGPGIMSSAESFLLMLKQGEKVTLVGAPSYGSSGNPKPFKLPNEVEIFIPSWKDMLPDGSLLEGKGVPPDVKVKAKASEFEKDDPVLKRALELLREKNK
jgi:hypothetical protein